MKLIVALLLILSIFLASTLATYQGKAIQNTDSSQDLISEDLPTQYGDSNNFLDLLFSNIQPQEQLVISDTLATYKSSPLEAIMFQAQKFKDKEITKE